MLMHALPSRAEFGVVATRACHGRHRAGQNHLAAIPGTFCTKERIATAVAGHGDHRLELPPSMREGGEVMGMWEDHVGPGTFSTCFLAFDSAKRVWTVIDKNACAGRSFIQFRARWQCINAVQPRFVGFLRDVNKSRT